MTMGAQAGAGAGGRIGLREIAQEAGCSVSTVSRILNNYDNFSVSDEIRERVLRVVKERKYAPNPILRTIRAQKTWLITLLECNAYTHEVGSVMRQSFVPVMQKAGYRVGSNFLGAGAEGGAPDFFPDWNVDGVAVTEAPDAQRLARLDDSGLPYVSLNGVCGSGGDAVIPDEVQGMRLAVEHLTALGHREIAYAVHETSNRPGAQHFSLRLREEAYQECLRERGLRPHPALTGCEDAMCAAVRASGVTAVICYNLFTGVAVLQGAWRLGIAVPQALSVVSFDDIYPAKWTIPPMTSIASPVRQIGAQAAQRLLEMIQDPKARRGISHILPCELVVRQSTAPAPGRVSVAPSACSGASEDASSGSVDGAAAADRRRRSAEEGGFTLIEMLVVIAIIGVLAAILMPSLTKALESSRTYSCKNNIRQVQMGAMSYADDCGGALSPYWYGATYNTAPWWFSPKLIGAYVGNKSDSTIDLTCQVLRCPSASGNGISPNPVVSFYSRAGISMNYWISVPNATSKPTRLSTIRYPSRLIYFIDGFEMRWMPVGTWYGWYDNQTMTNTWNGSLPGSLFNFAYRHNGGTNGVFIDGHAETFTDLSVLRGGSGRYVTAHADGQ